MKAEAAQARIDAIRKHLQPQRQYASLEGQVAVITGCNSLTGIGYASALAFCARKPKAVYVTDKYTSNLDGLVDQCRKVDDGCKIVAAELDAADEGQVESLVKRVMSENGRLDIFFANAGVASYCAIDQTDFDHLRTIWEINAASAFHAIKFGSQAMRQTSETKRTPGGSIVCTSSVAGLRNGAGDIAYSSSKASIISMVQLAAYQLSQYNIRVNALCPGFIETAITQPVVDRARARGSYEKVGQLNPSRRAGTVEEVASVALMLASAETSYVNGQAWAVDGGLSASHPVVPGKMA